MSRLESNINGEKCSVKRISKNFFAVYFSDKDINILIHKNDIKHAARSSSIECDYRIMCSEKRLDELNILECTFVLEFEHFSITGGETIKFKINGDNKYIYVPEKYFKSNQIPRDSGRSSGDQTFIVGERGMYGGVVQGLFISMPYHEYTRISPARD